MSDTLKNATPENEHEMRLDDESRVKVLSPGMLVLKRFMRNRLAITGLVILVVMFLFSFVGGLLSPYGQAQVFYKYEKMMKNYASVMANTEFRYTAAEGSAFSSGARAQFILALNNNKGGFTADGAVYSYMKISDDAYRIVQSEEVGTALGLRGSYAYTGDGLTEEITAAFEAAQAEEQNEFELDGVAYVVTKAGKSLSISRAADVALATMNIYDAFAQETEGLVGSITFRLAVENAMVQDETSLTIGEETYRLEEGTDRTTVYGWQDGKEVELAIVSGMLASAIAPDVRMTVAFKDAILDALNEKQKTFTFPDPDGTEVDYQITTMAATHTVKRETITQLLDRNASPSPSHWLGTDPNGMDMITRLMYGGRISLMVGFVVVLIELFIGVVLGGVAGYFGKWIDTLLMRFIDLFNCIPYYPVMIIAGAVMDSLDVLPMVRIFLLMLILGLLGWTDIARTVRGQILSLREQDFMVATEATGVRVSRRIFRHLVPNVMPLLIVRATMNLGSIIITEATLSFLGLGLKYPMASWGTIINAATDIYVMMNFWFIWIPAGTLILLTVLGFNFVGDGLRDAFDPKMKR